MDGTRIIGNNISAIQRIEKRSYDIFRDQNGESVFIRGKIIGKGGEAEVYEYRSDKVAKLFKTYDPEREQKLKFLLQLVDLDQAFCLPERLLYDNSNRIAGYIMSKREGYILGESVFLPENFSSTFPNWTRIELTILALRCLEAIDNLHGFNILVGDMNASNIIVESPGKVSFIDVDSYQIGPYRCKVGTLSSFTSPRLQGADFQTEPRTIEDEYFAAATLVFMIFLLGKSPYSNQGGNIGDNIRKRLFDYPLNDNEINDLARNNLWGRIWKLLPGDIRYAFYKVFREGDKIGYKEWRRLLRRYLSDLESNRYSRVIFPKH